MTVDSPFGFFHQQLSWLPAQSIVLALSYIFITLIFFESKFQLEELMFSLAVLLYVVCTGLAEKDGEGQSTEKETVTKGEGKSKDEGQKEEGEGSRKEEVEKVKTCWRVGLKVAWDIHTPGLALPLQSGDCYYMTGTHACYSIRFYFILL